MFAIDLAFVDSGSRVDMTGYVQTTRSFRSHTYFRLRDITGAMLVKVSRESGPDHYARLLRGLKKGTRIRVNGTFERNDEDAYIDVDQPVEVLGRITSGLDGLDAEMRKHASAMLMSRVVREVTGLLDAASFTEFASSAISAGRGGRGLEPLRVVYPGFGSAVTLATSPSIQVLDFITTTGITRAYSVSSAFATSHRFADAGVESKVICARAVDLPGDDFLRFSWQLVHTALLRLGVKGLGSEEPVVLRREWPPSPEELKTKEGLSLLHFPVSIPVDGGPWQREVREIIQIVHANGSPLLEGARETVRDRLTIWGIVLHPAQFLPFLGTTSARQLRDLGRFNVWES